MSFYNYFFENPLIIQYNNSRQIINFLNYFILSCSFNFLNLKGSSEINNCGSCIYLSNFKSNLLIELSQFISCSSFQTGGAIFFKTNNGNFRIIKSCSFNNTDFSTSYHYSGQFSYIENSNNNFSEINDISISYSINPNKYSPITFKNGLINIKYLNSTNNKLYYYSGIKFYNINNGNISYCNFISNIATKGICIKHYSGNTFFTGINIINNIDLTSDFGIIRQYSGNSIFLEVNIYNNSNKYIFAKSSGSLKVINSTLQNNFLDKNNNIELINNILISTFYNFIINNNYCNYLKITKLSKKKFSFIKLIILKINVLT